MMIKTAIKLYKSLNDYYYPVTWPSDLANKEKKNKLSTNNWKISVRLKSIFCFFFQVTKQMEENTLEKTYDTL